MTVPSAIVAGGDLAGLVVARELALYGKPTALREELPGPRQSDQPDAWEEGAVSSVLEAAAQLLQDYGETKSLPVLQVPPVWPQALLVAARILLIPKVALARDIVCL